MAIVWVAVPGPPPPWMIRNMNGVVCQLTHTYPMVGQKGGASEVARGVPSTLSP